MWAIRLDIAEMQARVFHMYLREHRHELSFQDFFLPFGGKRSGTNRWIKLAELVPWDELEHDYASQFCKGFRAPAVEGLLRNPDPLCRNWSQRLTAGRLARNGAIVDCCY